MIWKAEVSKNYYSSVKAIMDRGGKSRYGDATRFLLVIAVSLETDAEIPVDCHLASFYNESESEVAQSCWLFVTPWTAAYQAPLSMGFSRQEYWSG